MKKLISSLLAILIFASVMPTGMAIVGVAEEIHDLSIVFQLQIDTAVNESDEEAFSRGYYAKNVVDATDNVTYNGFGKELASGAYEEAPILGKDLSFPYLTFADPERDIQDGTAITDSVNKKLRALSFELEPLGENNYDKTLANKDEVSIEMWYRDRQNDNPFGLTTADNRTRGIFAVDGFRTSSTGTKEFATAYPAFGAAFRNVDTSGNDLSIGFKADAIGGKFTPMSTLDNIGNVDVATDKNGNQVPDNFEDSWSTTSYLATESNVDITLVNNLYTDGIYDGKIANEWHHMVINRIWNANDNRYVIETYIDGVKKADQYQEYQSPLTRTDYAKVYGPNNNANTTNRHFNYNVLTIGRYKRDTDGYFAGDIAEFVVRTKKLESADVSNAFRAGFGKYFPDMTGNGTKIFDMDLKGSVQDSGSGQVLKITNAVDNKGGGAAKNSGDITFGYAHDGTEPTYIKENGVEFLRFAYLDKIEGEPSGTEWKNKNAQVNVNMKKTVTSWANADALTFETWVREKDNGQQSSGGEIRDNKSVFAFGALTPGRLGSFMPAFQLQLTGNNIELYPDMVAATGGTLQEATNGNAPYRKLALGDIEANENKWMHYVVTREWVEGNITLEPDDPDYYDHWESNFYINGQKSGAVKSYYNSTTTGSGEEEITTYQDCIRTNYDTVKRISGDSLYTPVDYLIIGGTSKDGENRAFNGDIAEFNMYAGALTEEQVLNAYYNSVGTYYQILYNLELRNQSNDILTPDTMCTATKIQVDGLITSFDTEKELPSVFLAVYGEGDKVVTCKNLNVTRGASNETIVVNDSIDGLDLGSVTDAKLFIWSNSSNLQPLFDAKQASTQYLSPALDKYSGKYKITMQVSDDLQGSSVKKENLVVYENDTNRTIEVLDVNYMPSRREIVLSLANDIDPTATFGVIMTGDSGAVLDLNGNEAIVSNIDLIHGNFSNIYGVSVQRVRIEQNGISVLQPDLTKSFNVYVDVVNTTHIAQNRKLRLHLGENVAQYIAEENIDDLPGETTREFYFEVTPEDLPVNATDGLVKAVVY